MSDTPSKRETPPRFDWTLAKKWAIVFAVNLIVPLLLGISTITPSGRFGMYAAFAVVYWVGLSVCGSRFRVGRSLVVGGAVLSVSQFYPVPQVLFAVFADGTWKLFGGRTIVDVEGAWENGASAIENTLGAFLVVLFASWWMCLLAILLGACIRYYREDFPLWRNPPANADPDAAGG